MIKQKEENEAYSFRYCAYLLSQYFWFVFFIIPVAITFFSTPKYSSFTMNSAEIEAQFDPSADPRVMAMITDVHMTLDDVEPVNMLNSSLDAIVYYKAEVLISGGDNVYSFSKKKSPRESKQMKIEWDNLFSAFESHKDDLPFMVNAAGNHDLYNIYSVDSDKFYFLDKYSSFNRENTKTEEDFQLKYFEHNGYGFVVINPIIFPTPQNPLLIYAHPSKSLLDSLEKMIEEHPDCIVLSHYPVSHWWKYTKSSSGKTFREIISSENVRVFLSGHTHPRSPSVLHLKEGGMEVVAPTGKRNGSFTIITDDNGRLGFHLVQSYPHELSELPHVFITHPLRIDQVSERAPFKEKNTEIRAIVYGDQNHDKNIQVSGDVEGVLTFQRTLSYGNDVSLYSMPLNLDYGIYHISFSGDYVDEFDFIIGEEKEVGKQRASSIAETFMILVIYLGIFWIIAFIATFTFVPRIPFIYNIEQWIEGKVKELSSIWMSILYYAFCAVFGFFVLRERVKEFPLVQRIFFFVLTLIPLVIPTYIVQAEGHPGIFWVYGFMIAGRNRFEQWNAISTLLYIVIEVLFPLFYLSGINMNPFKWPLCFEVIFPIISIVIIIYLFLFKYGTEMCGFTYVFYSIGYFYIPIIWIIALIIFTWMRYKKAHKIVVVSESSDDITDT